LFDLFFNNMKEVVDWLLFGYGKFKDNSSELLHLVVLSGVVLKKIAGLEYPAGDTQFYVFAMHLRTDVH
jgi:hypothetical protein